MYVLIALHIPMGKSSPKRKVFAVYLISFHSTPEGCRVLLFSDVLYGVSNRTDWGGGGRGGRGTLTSRKVNAWARWQQLSKQAWHRWYSSHWAHLDTHARKGNPVTWMVWGEEFWSKCPCTDATRPGLMPHLVLASYCHGNKRQHMQQPVQCRSSVTVL